MDQTEDDRWVAIEDNGFVGHVGPILQRREDGRPAFAFLARQHHRNLRDVVQGGMLMTFADRAMGQTVRSVLGSGPIATVQFDIHFVDAARIGDFVVTRPQVLRSTASIVFVDARLEVDGRLVASASGIWKRLRANDPSGRTASGQKHQAKA